MFMPNPLKGAFNAPFSTTTKNRNHSSYKGYT